VSDTVKVRGDWHPENLASGRVVAPGEVFERSALDMDDPHDTRLVEEGVIIDADVTPVRLSGEELQERAKQLRIPNRSNLSADELRTAIARAEAQDPAPERPTMPEPPVRAGGA
jgi:hypothetical protein